MFSLDMEQYILSKRSKKAEESIENIMNLNNQKDVPSLFPFCSLPSHNFPPLKKQKSHLCLKVKMFTTSQSGKRCQRGQNWARSCLRSKLAQTVTFAHHISPQSSWGNAVTSNLIQIIALKSYLHKFNSHWNDGKNIIYIKYRNKIIKNKCKNYIYIYIYISKSAGTSSLQSQTNEHYVFGAVVYPCNAK